MNVNQLIALMVSMTVAGCSATFAQDNSSQARETLALQCIGKPFLEVSARARTQNTLPHVKLSLRDSLGRAQGENSSDLQIIPDSVYGTVVQIRSHPEYSTVLAIEVCNAEQGIYEIGAKEDGAESYVLDVTGTGDTENRQSLLLHHIPQPGRVLHYRFKFKIENRQVILTWLNKKGEEVFAIEPNDW